MPIYLAGPMRHYPQFNIPAFILAAKKLRVAGYNVISPIELDSQELLKQTLKSEKGDFSEINSGETWGQIISRDIEALIDNADRIALLPRWTRSKGARIEAFVAVTAGKPAFLYQEDPFDLVPISAESVLFYLQNRQEPKEYPTFFVCP